MRSNIRSLPPPLPSPLPLPISWPPTLEQTRVSTANHSRVDGKRAFTPHTPSPALKGLFKYLSSTSEHTHTHTVSSWSVSLLLNRNRQIINENALSLSLSVLFGARDTFHHQPWKMGKMSLPPTWIGPNQQENKPDSIHILYIYIYLCEERLINGLYVDDRCRMEINGFRLCGHLFFEQE